MLHTQTVSGSTLELLIKLMNIPELQQFFLVGGTNLSLQIGHRMSIDLDIFTDTPFDSAALGEMLQGYFDDMMITLQSENTLLCFINGVKVDFILYDYPLLEPVETIKDIRLVGLPDIITMKLNAIGRRSAKKDYRDIAHLLQTYSIEQMIEFFQTRHKSLDIGHIIRSLIYFDDAEKDDDPVGLTDYTRDQVKSMIKEKVGQYIHKPNFG